MSYLSVKRSLITMRADIFKTQRESNLNINIRSMN